MTSDLRTCDCGLDVARCCRPACPAHAPEQPEGHFCDSCETPVDPAKDKYCFDDFGGCLCENCRERAYDRHQEWLMETGGGPTLQEQQMAALRLK